MIVKDGLAPASHAADGTRWPQALADLLQKSRPAGRRLTAWTALLGLLLLAYTGYYLTNDSLPGNSLQYPIGWWGWFDQGNYIASARAFADGSWRTVKHFYPPLYSYLGSRFIRFWPANPFFLIDFVGLALHVASLVIVGRRIFGRAIVGTAIVGTFVAFPLLTSLQWVIPWTTSLSSGFGAVMILGFVYAQWRGWRLANTLDWVALAVFSVSLGSFSAVRPLDGVVWLPFAIIYFSLMLLPIWRLPSFAGRTRKALLFVAVVAPSGLLFPALNVKFNLVTNHSWMGSYVAVSVAAGYDFHGFGRKILSLLVDSSAVYVERGQAVADRFWPLYVAVPLLFHALARGPLLLKALAVTIIAQFVLYVPYGDLLPNGVFRYYNIHYFSWTFPWLMLLTLGYLVEACRRIARRTRLWAVGAVAILVVLALALDLRTTLAPPMTVTVSPPSITASFEAPHGVDYIDFAGVTGSFPEIFFGAHKLEVDGQPVRVFGEFRLFPTDQGIRLIFPRRVTGQRFVLTPDPRIQLTSDPVFSRGAEVTPSLTCRISRCTPPPFRRDPSPLTLPASVSFDAAGVSGRFVVDGWMPPEVWGRWSTVAKAELAFRIDRPDPLKTVPLTIALTLQPLVASGRPTQRVTVTANGCALVTTSFKWPDDMANKTVTGTVASSCIGADGLVTLDVATDRAASPRSIGGPPDDRVMGVGLVKMTVAALPQ